MPHPERASEAELGGTDGSRSSISGRGNGRKVAAFSRLEFAPQNNASLHRVFCYAAIPFASPDCPVPYSCLREGPINETLEMIDSLSAHYCATSAFSACPRKNSLPICCSVHEPNRVLRKCHRRGNRSQRRRTHCTTALAVLGASMTRQLLDQQLTSPTTPSNEVCRSSMLDHRPPPRVRRRCFSASARHHSASDEPWNSAHYPRSVAGRFSASAWDQSAPISFLTVTSQRPRLQRRFLRPFLRFRRMRNIRRVPNHGRIRRIAAIRSRTGSAVPNQRGAFSGRNWFGH